MVVVLFILSPGARELGSLDREDRSRYCQVTPCDVAARSAPGQEVGHHRLASRRRVDRDRHVGHSVRAQGPDLRRELDLDCDDLVVSQDPAQSNVIHVDPDRPFQWAALLRSPHRQRDVVTDGSPSFRSPLQQFVSSR